MNTLTKPIKRSKYLVPLSREHHDGLLFSWKIHRGLALGIELERITHYCNWFYETHLKAHFRKEEYGLSKIISIDDPMMVRMLKDHEAIKMKLNILNEGATASRLEHLAQFLGRHVRFEERELFNYIESMATTDQLKELFCDLNDAYCARQEWSDEFWISSI